MHNLNWKFENRDKFTHKLLMKNNNLRLVDLNSNSNPSINNLINVKR